jgi:hypothetical protein
MISQNAMTQSETSEQFQVLRKQFHLGLPARLESLKLAVDPQLIHNLLHSLSGAAGLYGDHVLSTLAQKAICCLLQNQINSYESTLAEISQCIEHLVRA